MGVADSPENVKACVCPGCPTFRESHLNGVLFCARGKAKEPVRQKGCICPNCSVWKNNKLIDQYYCSIGSANR